ncbi:hypothetical protein SCRM01_260 [Synechococcus phage S-CRM01]|uniref:hypothetical protein n=1 Tax=Synechococcus phage S-CRM01 TaxID=1026955 RepID=UPI000209E455|nr:hypothetical protein SCRM01_260 [Synechococcus phage S-CRM01]AEC53206.1 hypothetical protein SCRM01_260 [Synechococcus phage S-CRM01]
MRRTMFKLYSHEDNSSHDSQYVTIRHSWIFLRLQRFTLLEVHYSHDRYDGGWAGVAFILSLIRNGALLGFDVQTHQRDMGVYLFNWSDHVEYSEWEVQQ